MQVVFIISHVGVFLLGVATGLPFTLWEGNRVTHPPKEHPVDTTPHAAPAIKTTPGDVTPGPRRPRGPVLVIVLLIVSALMVGFGVQQAIYQHRASQRDACYETWGRRLISTVNTRTESNVRIGKAQKGRDDALDNIILVVIALRSQNPPLSKAEQDKRFGDVLAQFASAKSRLDRVQREGGATRANHPYPRLHCR